MRHFPVICAFATAFVPVRAASDASSLGATPNPAPGPGVLTAWVMETVDPHSGRAGLGELLRRAGFRVEPLPLDRPPFEKGTDPESDVDLIAFGSFASTSAAYRAYMAAHAADLDDYIDRAGLLVHFSQADQDEPVPPFLPDTQEAARDDRDFTLSRVLSPAHPLLAGVPRGDGGTTVSYELGSGDEWFRRKVQWESFASFHGFEVILAGDAVARHPGLMEGAYGQGRFIVSALANDKILDPTGTEVAPASLRDFNRPFFRNLHDHAAKVRKRQAPALKLTAPPGSAQVPEGGWTLVLLPDTQIYSQNFPGIFDAQTAWILHQARPRNISYVLHLGDIVNVNSAPEWENARRSMSLLDGRVPYAIVPGNHDYGPGGNAATRDTGLNDHFKEADYLDWPTFGGTMESGKMDNSYHLFEAGGVKWIVVALEWGPRDATVEWANGIMSRHPDRKGILVTHAYMNHDDHRYDHRETSRPQAYNPHHYKTPGGVNDGAQLWEKLVRRHDFALTFNGHVLGDGTGYRVDLNDAGRPVHQMLSNYQFRQLGGEGYLRLIEFQPDGKTVHVRSYSPVLHDFLLEPDQDFRFQLDLGAPDRDGDGVLDYHDADYDDDGDGLDNRDEHRRGTSSDRCDSDGDGLEDAREAAAGTDPLVSDRRALELLREMRPAE
jgi:hypothetical protein